MSAAMLAGEIDSLESDAPINVILEEGLQSALSQLGM